MMINNLVCSKMATFEPKGYITAANVGEFQDNLITIVSSQNYFTCLVDMSQVEFLDSAGLMALVSAFRLAQNLGKHFSICSVAPSVRIIFELTQLDRVFDIFESREQFDSFSNHCLAA